VQPQTAAKLIEAFDKAEMTEQFEQLAGMEIRRHKQGRFPLETLLGWMDRLGELNRYGDLFELLNRGDSVLSLISKEKIVTWGLDACKRGDYRSGGCLLLTGDYVPKSNREIRHLNQWTCEAASTGNHGAGRLYPILLLRLKPKKRGRLSQDSAAALANASAHAYAGEDGFGKVFLAVFLLRMAHEQLRSKDFSLVLDEFQKQVAEHQTKEAASSVKLYAEILKLF